MNDLRVTDLTLSIGGTEILRGASLSVAHGDFGVIVGPSGCGKSTLLRAIAGLVRPSGGQVAAGLVLLNDDRTFVLPEHRRIGWVPQDISLFPHLTVSENVAYGARGRRRQRNADPANDHRDLLDLIELTPFADRYPDQLSGGQAARVSLARALASQPGLLLLDEPFAALDPSLRVELRNDLHRMLQELNVTALLVTHDQAEALELAANVMIMRDGRVVQQGTPAEVYAQPRDSWTATFLGETVFLDAVADGRRAHTPLGDVTLDREHSGPTRVMLRPEQLALGPAGVSCTVTRVRYGGHDALVELRAGSGLSVLARVQASGIPQLGQEIGITVRGEGIAYPTCPADSAG